MTEPRVSVIIPARDAAPTLERTLTCLARQDLTDELEIIVVDDGSRDGTADVAARHAPLVRLVQESAGGGIGNGTGPGAARNRGVAAARAPVLAFTDADCFPTPRWLREGLAALERADLVQGRVVPDPNAPRTPFDRSLSVESDGAFYQTANLFVRRETFARVGGFKDWALERPGRRRWSVDRRRGRATRTPIGEDTLFAWSAIRLGARSTFAPDALVHHEVVPGGVRDALADRWHWTRDMPGLVRLVPELRRARLYRRVFFDYWTAYYDLALLGIAATVLTRRKLWLLAVFPYGRRLKQDAPGFGITGGWQPSRARAALSYALGTAIVDGVTMYGLLSGSVAWRCLVL